MQKLSSVIQTQTSSLRCTKLTLDR